VATASILDGPSAGRNFSADRLPPTLIVPVLPGEHCGTVQTIEYRLYTPSSTGGGIRPVYAADPESINRLNRDMRAAALAVLQSWPNESESES
jgi:hypothetical protein